MSEVADVSALAQLQQVWTFDDLLALPDDVDWRRYEIVDGALVMSPSASMRHEMISDDLRAHLRRSGLPAFRTAGPMAVDLNPTYRIPDLVVVSAQVADTAANPLPARDVSIVVEIESPSSTTDDRVTKPAQYAAHGIPVYVRVETDPDVRLVAYELLPGETVYTELGTWGPGETAHLGRPFPVDIPIVDITP